MTPFERQQALERADRWLQEFHKRAPILFSLRCTGLAIVVFSVTFLLVDLFGRLAGVK